MASCFTCGADWTAGSFTEDCDECDGGALERSCMVCGGRCGATWQRAVSDSNDSRIGHWAGACKLTAADQRDEMERQLKAPTPD